MSTTEPVRPGRAQWGALILFAGASGAVDVLAFTALGRVFAGVMTGNLVLLGLALTGTGDEGGPAVPLLALTGYVAGVAVVAPFTGRLPEPSETRWPRAVVHWLAVEVVVLVAVAVAWGVAGGAPAQPWRDVVLVAVAAAMGIQSAALAGAGAAGGPGTYFTGTLTHLVVGASGPRGVGRADLGPLARLLALTAGAAGAALVYSASAAWAMVVPLLWALAALACVAVIPRRGALRLLAVKLRVKPGRNAS
ncbi:YoaK family protein [Streptomyces sp. NPDC050433]|uniref:YoaK family protein n=1 Tax=unclassified Streptomyces TaxID=2593676 RepID=UPI00341C3CAB